ncbi:uncharacterized protein LOC134726494 [Mytilus trossulus]|uniref:uncharacterized protein LOC134726494 n=1 Tax=Mytilus trossulus TaxID=6551 RepID=UPI00300783E7
MLIPHIVAVVAALCTCNGELLAIQQYKLDIINVQTSAVLFDYIVAKINDTVDEEKVFTQSCDTKVNQTLKSCDECLRNVCEQVPEISRPDSEHSLSPNPEMFPQMINIPIPDIAKLIKEIGKRVGHEAARFGKKIGKVLQKLGGGVGRTIRKVGGVLTKVRGGIKKIGSKVGSHVKRLGKGVARVGNHIGQGVGRIGKHIGKSVGRISKNIVRGVGTIGKNIGRRVGSIGKNIGRGVGRIGKNIGRGVGRIGKNIARGVGRFGKNIGRGVGRLGKKVGHGIKNTGKKIWSGFKKIFGKRSTRHLIAKRCVHSCPVCDVLDTTKNTDEQIVRNICGSDFVSRQQQVFDKVRGFEDTYNYIVDQPVVTKVEYDTSSLIVASGKMAFKKSFVTFQTDKIKKRFQLSGIFEFSNIEDMAIQISKDILAKMLYVQ